MTSMEARFGDATRIVPLPTPWNVTAYLAAVAAHRGRSISLHPVPRTGLADASCGGGGLWVARNHDDIVVFDAEAVGRNIDHIILHQVGHMLLGHDKDDARAVGLPASLAVVLPSISPQSVRQALGRDDFGPELEQEAEVFADMMMVYSTLPRRRKRSFRLFGRGG